MNAREHSPSGCGSICEADADVRVRVRSNVVEVDVEDTRVRPVAPVTAGNRPLP